MRVERVEDGDYTLEPRFSRKGGFEFSLPSWKQSLPFFLYTLCVCQEFCSGSSSITLTSSIYVCFYVVPSIDEV